jgi:hypothetical protein
MRLPIIKRIATDYDLAQDDLYGAVKVLETISRARGVSEEELDVIGELISNIEGAKIVVDQNRNYGVPTKDALNTFMKRVINSVN